MRSRGSGRARNRRRRVRRPKTGFCSTGRGLSSWPWSRSTRVAFFFLAAGCWARLCLVLVWLAWLPCAQASRTAARELSPEQFASPTSPQETRVGGPLPAWSGRLISDAFLKLSIAPTYDELAYEIVSGRRQWPNRDPLGIEGGINLYAYVGNRSIDQIDPYGLEWFWQDIDWDALSATSGQAIPFGVDAQQAAELEARGYSKVRLLTDELVCRPLNA